jgi:DNA-binding Lrp family transcriptional regulator
MSIAGSSRQGPQAPCALDATDRAIVAATACGLPLVPAPFAAVGETIGISEGEVIARMARLQAAGAIRRIAAVPNHYAVGVTANGMAVFDVEDAEADRLGAAVGALDYVSHCYLRPRRPPVWPYNLFAMLHGTSRAEVAAKVQAVRRLLGPACRANDVLYSTRILKKTGLRIDRHGADRCSA